MAFEAWEEYWRRTPAAKIIVVKGIKDPASRLDGLQIGELDLAFGMTGKLLARLMGDRNLRWNPNLTAPLGSLGRQRMRHPEPSPIKGEGSRS
jgi:ABC-type transport system substrate-binding protein